MRQLTEDEVDELEDTLEAATEYRGHKFTNYREGSYSGHKFIEFVCTRCERYFRVEPDPPPNGAFISGPAVALDCSVLPHNTEFLQRIENDIEAEEKLRDYMHHQWIEQKQRVDNLKRELIYQRAHASPEDLLGDAVTDLVDDLRRNQTYEHNT